MRHDYALERVACCRKTITRVFVGFSVGFKTYPTPKVSTVIEKHVLTEVYAALLGVRDADFTHTSVDEIKQALLDHFKPEHMESLFQQAFTRGIKYALLHQKFEGRQLSEEDFFGGDGLIIKHIDWDEEMLDWD